MLNVNYRPTLDPDLEEVVAPTHYPGVLERDAGHTGHSGSTRALDLWGGVECTVNRVQDRYLDQLELNGHANRLEDLDRFAELGIRALRYPVLWERTIPDGPRSADWRWADERLARLRSLGVRPIVGLVHHGSGPRSTSLVDPRFGEKLAEYARSVAERYPWVEAYTPINEIITTARFSGLYGHWYPHGRDERTFGRVLLNECRGTILAMRAIREVNPQARLVQTDDLGKTLSTPELGYQAEFDNARRWLGWDLLCGRVDREHALWGYLIHCGVAPGELEWFLEQPCPPDILGVNYYVTSERYLDHNCDRYPEWTHGGNGRHQYADVETVRVSASGIAGPEVLLREAWERYRIPLAVTEAHLGCTREEQLRWLLQVWRAAAAVRRSGADVRAVTAWSLLGAYDWNSLLTENHGYYEPGVFDLRGGHPRPTALAGLMRDLAAGREPDHPLFAVPGWWSRPERLVHPPVEIPELDTIARNTKTDGSGTAAERLGGSQPRAGRQSSAHVRPLVITGGAGPLGQAFARLCEVRGLPYRLVRHSEMDLAVPFSVGDALDDIRPWAVIHTGPISASESGSEVHSPEESRGALTLAAGCARQGIPLVAFSSGRVFDGEQDQPYVESDPVTPPDRYGRRLADAEGELLAAHPGTLLVRTGVLFGPWDVSDIVTSALQQLADGQALLVDDSARFSPAYLPDLVNGSLDLLIDGECGLWHLANRGAATWLELLRQVAALAGVDARGLSAVPGRAEPVPLPRVLGSERGEILPSLDQALAHYVRDRAWIRSGESPAPRQDVGRTDCPAVTA